MSVAGSASTSHRSVFFISANVGMRRHISLCLRQRKPVRRYMWRSVSRLDETEIDQSFAYHDGYPQEISVRSVHPRRMFVSRSAKADSSIV
jgi:hypothetical protein